MAVTRTAHCWESQFNLDFPSQNKWLWQVAKKVSSGLSPATSNVIWQSAGLAPNMAVSWDVVYVLNWTAYVPSSGASVTISGNWQECTKGAVYDLDVNGIWTQLPEPALPG